MVLVPLGQGAYSLHQVSLSLSVVVKVLDLSPKVTRQHFRVRGATGRTPKDETTKSAFDASDNGLLAMMHYRFPVL